MSQISQLYTLQKIDTEILTSKKKLMGVLTELKDSAELDQAKETSVQAEKSLASCRVAQTELEKQLSTLKDKLIESQQLLYSGKIKDSREVSTLKGSVEKMRAKVPIMEEQTFEAMENTEQALQNAKKATEGMLAAQEAYNTRQQKLSKSKNKLALAVNELLEKRKAHKVKISGADMKTYMSIFKSRKGLAVVTVHNQICGGCRTGMSASRSSQVDKGELVTCSSCGRLLIKG